MSWEQQLVAVSSGAVSLKSALMEHAARVRGMPIRRMDRRTIIVDSGQRKGLAFEQMNGPDSSVAGKLLCDHKEKARVLLDLAGLPTARSRSFSRSEVDVAWQYASTISGPVVTKPLTMSGGRGVTTGIESYEQLRKGFTAALVARSRRRSRVLVEQQVTGEDFRIFVVDGDLVSATHRRRASVIGDGRRTLAELIEAKNLDRSANPYLGAYPIPTEPRSLDRLQAAGLTLESVPSPGTHVVLRSASNLSAGGDSIDVTEEVDPEFVELARRAIEAIPGVEYGGVDIIARDISGRPSGTDHVVSEVEFSPAPMAHFPWDGTPRDMAGRVLERYLTS